MDHSGGPSGMAAPDEDNKYTITTACPYVHGFHVIRLKGVHEVRPSQAQREPHVESGNVTGEALLGSVCTPASNDRSYDITIAMFSTWILRESVVSYEMLTCMDTQQSKRKGAPSESYTSGKVR